ncbi:MAG: hypothetical protein R3C49_07660 [Planctomycetaceae bacterium]
MLRDEIPAVRLRCDQMKMICCAMSLGFRPLVMALSVCIPAVMLFHGSLLRADSERPSQRRLELPVDGASSLQQQLSMLKQLQSLVTGPQSDTSSQPPSAGAS